MKVDIKLLAQSEKIPVSNFLILVFYYKNEKLASNFISNTCIKQILTAKNNRENFIDINYD